MKRIDQVLSAAALAIILGAGLIAANWPSISGSTSPGVVIEDGAGNKLGVTGSPVIVQQITDALDTNYKVSSSTLTATSNTTLATVPNLSIPLAAGKTYYCRVNLFTSSGATGGIKVGLNAGGGSLTATSSSFVVQLFNGSTFSSGATNTTFGTNNINGAGVFTNIFLEGAIVVNAAGNFVVQAAQAVSDATSTLILVNSAAYCKRTT